MLWAGPAKICTRVRGPPGSSAPGECACLFDRGFGCGVVGVCDHVAPQI